MVLDEVTAQKVQKEQAQMQKLRDNLPRLMEALELLKKKRLEEG